MWLRTKLEKAITMNDIRSLDFNLLKAFHALLEERSVTRAAARLSLTQPAVSGMLNRLRENFDDPLFVRAQRGVIPTPRALDLAEPLQRVLRDIEAMLQPAQFEPASAQMTISIAGTDYSLRAVVVPFLTALRQRAPGIRVAMLPIEDDRVLSQLERGELDLALMTPASTPPELHARRLFDEEYVCVLRADHPVIENGTLTLDRFCELDHAIVSYAGGGFRGATDAALEALGRTRRVVLSLPSFLVLPEVLRASDLVAMVPRRLIGDLAGLALVEVPLVVPGFTKIVAWHERTHANAAQAWLRALLFEVCGS